VDDVLRRGVDAGARGGDHTPDRSGASSAQAGACRARAAAPLVVLAAVRDGDTRDGDTRDPAVCFAFEGHEGHEGLDGLDGTVVSRPV
jgi:hypothetical protein